MRNLLVVLTLAAAAGGCRERADVGVDDNRVEVRKTTETSETADEDFIHTRTTYETHTRDRLARIDARIRELAERGEVKAEAAAEELRVQRDKLAKQLERVGEQAKPAWDRFEAEVSRGIDELEHKLDAAFTRD
jgi:hypothetical protein